jgi:oligopeptide transport system permease protein
MFEETTKTKAAGTVANLSQPVKRRSPFQDSLARLMRNRFAVLGLIIIVINFTLAIFADFVAPFDYAQQDREAANAAPQVVIDMFGLKVRDESWRVRDGETVHVQTGDAVQTDDPLITERERRRPDIFANMDGTVFVDDSSLELTQLEVERIPIPANAQLLYEGLGAGSSVDVSAGDELLVTGDETIVAPIDGKLYLDADGAELLVRPPNIGGYVALRAKYPLGADNLGRDLLSRIIYGARVSLSVAIVGPLTALIIGLTIGLLSGYIGGWVDNLLMRFVDVVYAFPTLLLIILMMTLFRSDAFTQQEMQGTLLYNMAQLDRSMGGMLFIFIGIGLTSWVGLSRLTRGQVLSIREQEYIIAARAMGGGNRRILLRHVLPNIMGPIVVAETLTIPTYIRYEAFLSFIGLGVNPPTPSWGGMISEGADAINAYPYQALFPALALFFIMFAFNFLGDGLRDALDPRMRGVD